MSNPKNINGTPKTLHKPYTNIEGRPFLKRTSPLLCIFSGENTNTTKDFSLVVVFSIGGDMRKAPSGRELDFA